MTVIASSITRADTLPGSGGAVSWNAAVRMSPAAGRLSSARRRYGLWTTAQ